MVIAVDLDPYVGKHISEICDSGFSDDARNHCAHFVSHALGLSFGVTCRSMGTNRRGAAASIRVHEVFSRCTRVGLFSECPATTTWGLVFILDPRNVNLAAKRMDNVQRKHVGIFVGPQRTVYHYSNTRKLVVRCLPAEFGTHYPPPDNGLFWGSLPA